jgi:glycosyltransferase involved in cell wall biosynthesis
MPVKQFRLGFDARLAGIEHAGIGRYSEEILRELINFTNKLPIKIKWVIFLADKNQLPWLKDIPQCEIVVVPIKHYSLAEQLVLPWYFYHANLDCLHIPHFNVPWLYRKDTIVTIHDLLWHQQRDPRATTLAPWQYRLKYLAYRFVSRSAIKSAEVVLVPTQEVKKQIKQIVGRKNQVLVTSEGISQVFLSAPSVGEQKRAAKTKERAPYVVYTGSLYPHKNVDVVLEALTKMEWLHLIVATSRSVFTQEFKKMVKQNGLADRVKILIGQNDQRLMAIYQNALALIQPSLAEGFGLTGLEALAVGLPVVVSDIPVFREVYQDKADFFNPYQPEDLVQKLQTLEQNPPSIKQLKLAQQWARSFTWKKAAAKTWQAYETVLNYKNTN